MKNNPNALGWICSKCNTFWRDNNFTLTWRDKCPFDDFLRSKGREIILYLSKENK